MKIRNKKSGFLYSIFGFFRNSKFEIRNSRLAGGFALVELLVAVVLFGIITTFVLLAYSRVSSQLFLTTLAYEVALSFREAQSYGVSVHEYRGGASNTFDVGYGLYFDQGSLTNYVLFADEGGIAGDGYLYAGYGTAYTDSGCLGTRECLSVFKIERGNKIDKFCGVLVGDLGRDAPESGKQEECNVRSLPATNQNITHLDVTFLRPNPDAIIKTNRTLSAGQQYKAARVYLISPNGERRAVEVVTTGQMSIK